MAQKVFEGDVVFSSLIDREKSTIQNREHNISFEDFLGHLRDPRVYDFREFPENGHFYAGYFHEKFQKSYIG